MSNFTSKKIKNSTVHKYKSTPDKVFPLLCPVREYEWIEPWRCDMISSDSGIAEKYCVFRTGFFGELSKNDLSEEKTGDVWVVSNYEPNTRIEFIRINQMRIICLTYILSDNGDGTTNALIERLVIGLTEEGNQSIEAVSENFLPEFRMGEEMLNFYLTTGNMLPMKEAILLASK